MQSLMCSVPRTAPPLRISLGAAAAPWHSLRLSLRLQPLHRRLSLLIRRGVRPGPSHGLSAAVVRCRTA
jgi:hypothetical protein